ncbi:MAG: glutaminase, partial [Ignavibacteria bacterium]
MKKFFTNTKLAVIVLAVFLLSGPVNLFAQDLTKENIEKVLKEAYEKFKDVKEGANADYIKELATVDPNIFGIGL